MDDVAFFCAANDSFAYDYLAAMTMGGDIPVE